MRLKNEPVSDIPVCEMQDGWVAVITSWESHTNIYVGRIVQRYKNILVTLGKESGESWTDILNDPDAHPDCRVRILPKGTELVL